MAFLDSKVIPHRHFSEQGTGCEELFLSDKFQKSIHFKGHLSDLLRASLLYQVHGSPRKIVDNYAMDSLFQYGGIYSDSDILHIKPGFQGLQNAMLAEGSDFASSLLKLRKRHPIVPQFCRHKVYLRDTSFF